MRNRLTSSSTAATDAATEAALEVKNRRTPFGLRTASERIGTMRRDDLASKTLLAGSTLALGLGIAEPSMAADTLELVPDYAFFGLLGDGPGLGSLWIMLIGFVVLIFPLNALIFQPIFQALDARADRIQGARDRSAQLQREADQVLTRYESAIREARTESEASRQVQLGQAREEQNSLTTQARGEAEAEMERARVELDGALEEARTSLRASAEDLATAAAEQVLGRALW